MNNKVTSVTSFFYGFLAFFSSSFTFLFIQLILPSLSYNEGNNEGNSPIPVTSFVSTPGLLCSSLLLFHQTKIEKGMKGSVYCNLIS